MDAIKELIAWIVELYTAIADFIAGFEFDWAFEKEAE